MTQEKIIESENAPKCPFCGELASYKGDVDWVFQYKSCQNCGNNYLARKSSYNSKYESKKSNYE